LGGGLVVVSVRDIVDENLKNEGKGKGLASSKKQMGRNPKRTPTHARYPEKGEERRESRGKGKNTRNARKINRPRQLYQYES